MAARFNSHGSSTTSQASGSTSGKPKKFCTRGEEFFDFLKSLGYQPSSKHQTYEHFEYLFQDEKSTNFAKMLMATMKNQHCVLPEESERFETLKKQGFAIYGKDLEEAVSRRHAVNEMYSKQEQKKKAKQQDLDKELETKQKEIEQLRDLRDDLKAEVSNWKGTEAKISKIVDSVQRLIEESEKNIEIDSQLLSEKMSTLEHHVQQLKKDLSSENPIDKNTQYLCQMNGRVILDKEEKLFENVQEMIRKHGANLIIKDAGYEVDGDPMTMANVKKVFFQFEKDFDRLKHCIIYERVKFEAYQLSLAGQQGATEKFDECCRKAIHLSTAFDFETKGKLQTENREAVDNLTVVFQKESEELLDRVRESALEVLNHQFSVLTNIRARSKRKLQEFFTLVTNVLTAQKVRVTLLRNLVRSEGKLYSRLLSNIEENIVACSEHSKMMLASKSEAISGLTLEGQILCSILTLLRVPEPTNALLYLPAAHTMIRGIQNAIEDAYWTGINERNSNVLNMSKHLSKTREALKKVEGCVRDTTMQNCHIVEREERVKSLEERLRLMQQSRTCNAKEILKKKEANLETMKNLLHDHLSTNSFNDLSLSEKV